MKTAIVHDWLNGMRGGEKVLEEICGIFPEATVFTLFCEPEKLSPLLRGMRIKTSFVQNLPFKSRFYRNYLPLFPLAVEQFDLRGFGLVISSSHCAAKGALVPSDACHICYCHTPLRYGWDMYREYFGTNMDPARKAAVYPALHYLRLWDACSSARVDHYIANSRFVAGRIKKFYGRDARVIHPPVDTGYFTPRGSRKNYYLLVSALVPYKRVDIAVSAFTGSGLPLKIAGSGPLRSRLERRSGKNVEFVGEVSAEDLRELYSGAKAFVHTAVEDFGIAPVEAQAAGTPVIGLGRGGLLETVDDGKTGIFFHRQDSVSLAGAVKRFEEMEFDRDFIRERALRFDRRVFVEKLLGFIEEKTGAWTRSQNKKYSF